jgi:hypothetical protein
MATSGDIEVKPNHVIIWLDKNMGVSENNQSSKAVLDTNANLDRPPSPEYSPDIDNFICHMNSDLNDEKYDDLIKSPLRMFIQKPECIKCINDSIEAKKQPFLIASGQMGALIVPEIYKRLSRFIYIFCAQRDAHEEWTGPYETGMEIYDDEKGVFAKVLSDIAVYYLLKGQNETSNQTRAIKYLHWARRLFMSASKIDNIKRKDYLQCVRDELDERQVSPSDGNDSDCQISKDAHDE